METGVESARTTRNIAGVSSVAGSSGRSNDAAIVNESVAVAVRIRGGLVSRTASRRSMYGDSVFTTTVVLAHASVTSRRPFLLLSRSMRTKYLAESSGPTTN